MIEIHRQMIEIKSNVLWINELIKLIYQDKIIEINKKK